MDSLLELARRTHEDIERLEEAAVLQLLEKPKLHKERLMVEHSVSDLLDQMAQKSQYLLDLYRDDDGSRQREIKAIMPDTPAGDPFAAFYDRLRSIRDHHHRVGNELVRPTEANTVLKNVDAHLAHVESLFTGEESMGKYLDLHDIFNRYLNLKGVKKTTYLAFLAEFDQFGNVPTDTKVTPDYLAYLEAFRKYLESYFERAKPLFNFIEFRRAEVVAFDELWEANEVPGWENRVPTSKSDARRKTGAADGGDGGENATGDAAVSAAPAAASSGIYCAACDKLFAKQTVFDAHKTGKKHRKAAEALASKGVSESDPDAVAEMVKRKELEQRDKYKPVALAEALVKRYAQKLAGEREDTKAHVERKQTLTDQERMEDEMDNPIELAEDADNDDADEDEKVYNPLKLPLDFDGKPIPYWLYKLHGLGVEYPCEICGGYVYKGRKEFDRHFQESRHAHGMKCLGIPNTKQFHDITLINDAYALAEKLKMAAKQDAVVGDAAEEFEDDHGNVYNKKTYEDLKRQGLL
ncbi:hypothetical protein BC831DRAFT_451732 [Entophlyctis helioformis]|nr:hypothetical protein BC831DRAFT_451732 [Entophlyctis helioformis]